MAEPLSIASNVSQIGQLLASAGSAYVAAYSRHDDAIDIATRRIDVAASALSKLSTYTEMSPEIAEMYQTLEDKFIKLNAKFERTLIHEEELEKQFWFWKHLDNCLYSVSIKARPVDTINDVSKQMKNLTLRVVSASAGAESKFKRIAQIVRKDFTYDLDIKMLELYALKKNSMTKTEFMASVVRRAAATVLPTPDAVELYIALFSQKLDALSEEGVLASQQSDNSPAESPAEELSVSKETNNKLANLETSTLLQTKHKASNPFVQARKPELIEQDIPMVDICNKA